MQSSNTASFLKHTLIYFLLIIFLTALIAQRQAVIPLLWLSTSLILLAAVIFIQHFSQGFSFARSGVSLLILLQLIWMALSLTWSSVPYSSPYVFLLYLTFPLSYFLSTNFSHDDFYWNKTIFLFALFLTFVAILASIQKLVFQQPPQLTLLNKNLLAEILNIMAIYLCGRLLIALENLQRQHIPLIISMIILFFTIGLINSRAVIFTVIMGLIVFFITLRFHYKFKTRFKLILLVLTPLILAVIVTNTFYRLVDSDLIATGSGRWYIWQQAWKIMLLHPWLGMGLGYFRWIYPQYQLPQDVSAHAFVHNDYLQLWMETGIIGLGLLLALLAVIIFRYWQFYRKKSIDKKISVEITALFIALMTFFLHSFFCYDFYISPLLLLLGLFLTRFNYLISDTLKLRFHFLTIKHYIRPAIIRFCLTLLLFIILIFLSRMILANFYTHKATQALNSNNMQQAYELTQKSNRFYAKNYDNWQIQVNILLAVFKQIPSYQIQLRKPLYQLLLADLATMKKLVPYHAAAYWLQGTLYWYAGASLAGPQWQHLAEKSFEEGIRLQPRASDPRLAYAQYLFSQQDIQQIKKAMHLLLAANIPFHLTKTQRTEAQAVFTPQK